MQLKKNITPWLFIAPALVFIVIFSIYPLIETIFLSFMTQTRGHLVFNGINNFKRLFSDQYFYVSLKKLFNISNYTGSYNDIISYTSFYSTS